MSINKEYALASARQANYLLVIQEWRKRMAGRPREFDRDAALAKARDAFWSRGYEGVSMADLVQALGIASARIYAAFGSKELLFRESIALYDAGEGGFATLALAEEPTAALAIERSLREAAETYTREGRPRGCMVVSAAINCAAENDGVRQFLADYRRRRTASLIERFEQAAIDGDLRSKTDAQVLGDYYAAVLHGFSVQARDGVSRERLIETIPTAMLAIQCASTFS